MHWLIGQILGSFITDKCKVLHMGKNNAQHCYKMRKHGSNHRVSLEKSKIERYLSIQVDKDLRFSQHIDMQVNKANSLLGLLRKAYEHLDAESMKLLFTASLRIWKCCVVPKTGKR